MPVYALGEHTPNLPEDGTFWIAPNAHVIGQVSLGSDVGVWFGAVLRGDNEPIRIGAATNIQEGAMLHTDVGFPLTIGNGCTIGHHATVHGCRLGDNVLVGMGAIIMNGVRIESNSIVGAGALVTENKIYPEGALIVGSPAKLIKTLDDQAISGLKKSAKHYVDAWHRFAKSLKTVD